MSLRWRTIPQVLRPTPPLPSDGRGIEVEGAGDWRRSTQASTVDAPSTAFRLTFECNLAAARQACRTLRDFLADEGLAEKEQIACEQALTEACNNAVLYADPAGQRRSLEIQAVRSGTLLELHLIDHTPGFNWPDRIPLPEPEAEEGRGLFIMSSLVDDVQYLRGRGENRLIMRKQWRAARSSQSHSSFASASASSSIAPSPVIRHSSLPTAHELEIARKIQQSLLPRTFPPLAGLTLSGFCRSAQQVGGDFYDVLPLMKTSALIVVADVMGKGVPAALFAATLRTLVRTTAEWTQHPGELLERINRLMFPELSAVDMFITVQLAVVDLRRQTLTVANAGHCPLLIAAPDAQVQAIAPDDVPVGILPNAVFAEKIVPLEQCCSALFYTDGLTEARNLQGVFFGQERLMRWLHRAAQEDKTAAQLTENFKTELRLFQSETILGDDQTFLLLRQEKSRAAVFPEQLLEALPVLAPFSNRKSPI